VWFPTWVPPAGQPGHSTRQLEVGPAQAPRRFLPFKETRPVQHKQRKEMMRAMEATRQSYTDKGVEENIQKIIEQLHKTKAKIASVTKIIEETAEKGCAMSKMVLASTSK